jgi:plasmid maintenance system antidote protein VapI
MRVTSALIHPGEILLTEFTERMDLTAERPAKDLQNEDDLRRAVRERRAQRDCAQGGLNSPQR